ncbi:MAG: hypothetical protein JXQ73_32635 [Phycisphaerae bacterium]|nr:hypothetical protein [Phycisphaerae bacterium]
MKGRHGLFPLVILAGLPFCGCAAPESKPSLMICCPQDASPSETLSAREVCRYLYARTGQRIRVAPSATLPLRGNLIVVGRQDRPLIKAARGDAPTADLGPQQFRLQTIRQADRKLVLIVGGDDAGTLYAAYRFAERLGVRFYLHGDVVPDRRVALTLPDLDETAKPLFGLRGIQPFHDFPEGPDWWELENYKAIISQLPKLGMNFIGLHTYPEDRPAAEPTVWIGLKQDFAEDGRVAFSYPSIYYNTALPVGWGFKATRTSDYAFGADKIYPRDAYSSDIMKGLTPRPRTPEHCNEVFNRAGAFYRQAFAHAHALGVKTCVGTETPLVVPREVRARLQSLGKDPAKPGVIQELYEGMFARIAKAYPIDYYWFWTPEGWTWSGVKQEQIDATVADIKAAIAAVKNVGNPFTLGTCGWVLGPPSNRALFDKTLPKDMFMSCISRSVGHAPVEPGFAHVEGREKWAIPWLEDDPAMVSPQLWVARMRQDAADSLRYGCTGLMGIHWRTRILGPNVSALAKAAWDQTGWATRARIAGPLGGQIATSAGRNFADTDDDTLFQTVRYDVDGYYLEVPNGTYTVTLRLCEPAYAEKDKRVFGVKLEGKTVLDKLDMFATFGKDRAKDYTFKDVNVTDGWLDLDFIRVIELPCVAAIVIQGDGFSKKINCGGPAYKDYVADLPTVRKYPHVDDFYLDWATHLFGPEAGPDVAKVFTNIDCKLPRPSDWVNGPGGIKPDARPWLQVAKEYAFVDDLAAIRPNVTGKGNLARLDYWLETFRTMRANAKVNCAWARYNAAMAKVKAEKNPAKRRDLAAKTALPIRKELVAAFAELHRHLLPTVHTTGTMGTVTNWQQHTMPVVLTAPGRELSDVLGAPLPEDAQPGTAYEGPTRVFVAAVRTSATRGEALPLRVTIASRHPVIRGDVFWRAVPTEGPLGGFKQIALKHVARGCYEVALPTDKVAAPMLEYFVRVATADGKTTCWPPTAPELNQTVVLTER